MNTLMLFSFVQPITGINTPLTSEYPWPTFHHDNQRTGYTESPAPTTNHTRWIQQLEEWVLCYPIVDNGRIFTTDYGYDIYCLNQSTGELLWKTETPYLHTELLTVYDGKVFVTARENGNYIYALNAITGEIVWRIETGSSNIPPTIDRGVAYIVSDDEYAIYAINIDNGVILWNRTVSGRTTNAPGALNNGRLFVILLSWVNYNPHYHLNAFNTTDGNQLWKREIVTDYRPVARSCRGPSVGYGKVFVTSSDGYAYAFDEITGQLIWNEKIGDWVTVANGLIWPRTYPSTPNLFDGMVYVAGAETEVLPERIFVQVLDASSGEEIEYRKIYVEANEIATPNVSPPIVSNGKVLFSSCNYTFCIDAETLSTVWKYRASNELRYISLADSVLYVTAYNGFIYAFADSEEAAIQVTEIESNPWSPLEVPFKDVDEAMTYIEDFELSPSPQDFGEIPINVTIANTGYSTATGVSIDARMTGDISMIILDFNEDQVLDFHFDYSETIFTGGTIDAGGEITQELMLPIKYASLAVGSISLPEPDTNFMIPLEIVIPMISVHVTLTIKGNFDDVVHEIPEDTSGIGDPTNMLEEWNYQLSRRIQRPMLQVFLETYYSHVLNLKAPVIDINPNIPTGIYETPINILPGTLMTVITLAIPTTITFIGILLLLGGATAPIGGVLIAVGLAMIVVTNPTPGLGTVTTQTASPDVNMTLEIVQSIPENVETIDNVVVEDGQTFHVITVSNSTVTGFSFDKEEKQISLGINSTAENHRFCHATIPKELLRENATYPWQVKLNGSDISFTSTENETHGFVYFNVVDSGTYTIEIIGAEVIPEFPTWMIPLLIILTLLVAVILKKRKQTQLHVRTS